METVGIYRKISSTAYLGIVLSPRNRVHIKMSLKEGGFENGRWSTSGSCLIACFGINTVDILILLPVLESYIGWLLVTEQSEDHLIL